MVFTIIIILCFLCWLSSILFYKKKRAVYDLPIIFFLGLTTLIELTGYLVYFQFHQKNNYWVFNSFLPVETFFLGWLFVKILSPYFNGKPYVIAGLSIFSVLYLYESIQHHFLGMSMDAKKFASVFIILLCLSYYYFLLKKEEYVPLKKHPPFWLVSGCFFFYFGSICCDFFFEYLIAVNTPNLKPVRYIIFIVLNFIWYICWSYSFLCEYRRTISSP